MWQQYKKTLIPVQMFILTFALIVIFHFKVAPAMVVFIVVTLEFASLFGAKWSYRLTRKIQKDRNSLSLF